MGSRGPSASSQANTTTNNSEAISIGNLGLTGEQAVQGLQIIYGSGRDSLADLLASGSHVADSGYQFSASTVQQNVALTDRTVSHTSDTLNGLINASRDFAQRSIAGSTGQATPIQNLPAAANTTSLIGEGGISPLLLIGGAVVVLFLISRK